MSLLSLSPVVVVVGVEVVSVLVVPGCSLDGSAGVFSDVVFVVVLVVVVVVVVAVAVVVVDVTLVVVVGAVASSSVITADGRLAGPSLRSSPRTRWLRNA